ncbi:hypothetical protein K440DRAFT_681310 [Wilcoxina mikolae CBS 423.85]|nr:hypothetical protein K440DRAFT_681310 [Wilcoxina mikolae CBS 423.85]
MKSPILTRFTLFTVTSLILSTATAAPFDAPGWLKEMTPKKGFDMQSEIQCYTLPYGAIGFVSHILTYYTIVMLSAGLSPLRPWKKLKAPKWDMFLGVVGLLIGTLITVLTIYRCRQRWQFLLIAVWKSTLSVSLGALGVSASRETRRIANESYDSALKPQYRAILWWMILYVLGIFVGLTGLISLVINSWGERIRIVILASEIFGGITIGVGGLAGVLAVVFYYLDKADEQSSDAQRRKRRGLKFLGGGALVVFGVLLVACGFLAALYSDWVLAGLAGNLIGVPSKDNSALYYAYFAAKRLPFFSI